MNYFVLSAALLCSPVVHTTSEVARRTKRVIGGEVIIDKTSAPYKVLEYYVWIGHTWTCWEDLPWWQKALSFASPVYGVVSAIFRTCPEKPENLVCGGALIAPRIVQTACHCLSFYVKVKNSLWTGVAMNVDSFKKLNIYMGKTDVSALDYPILSNHFVIHQNCARFQGEPGYWKYDFGWIVLEELSVPVNEGLLFNTWGQIDYAGPYRYKDLATLYDTVLGEMHVCLLVGFGWTGEEGEEKNPSRYMKHAWIQMMDWQQCYDALFKSFAYDRFEYFNYNLTASWVCVEIMREPFGGIHSGGDSGSPITCNNNYFALVTGRLDFGRRRLNLWHIHYETAIYYAPESIAQEYRRDFEEATVDEGYFKKREELRILENLDKSFQCSRVEYVREGVAEEGREELRLLEKPYKYFQCSAREGVVLEAKSNIPAASPGRLQMDVASVIAWTIIVALKMH